jgi:hypothetical protein
MNDEPRPLSAMPRAWRSVLLAASIILGIAVGMAVLLDQAWQRHERLTHAHVKFATIVDARDTVFEASDLPTIPGSQLGGGFLRLRSGEVDIEFFSGARVTIEGPAVFGINSANRGILESGKLTADVPPAAHGFTIAAPGVSIVDLGTRFGVATIAGATQVHVLQGAVELHGVADRPTILRTNEAASVDISTRRLTPIAMQADLFRAPPPRPARISAPGYHMIASDPTRTTALYDDDFDGTINEAGLPSGSKVAIGDRNRPGSVGEVRYIAAFEFTPEDQAMIRQSSSIELVMQVQPRQAGGLPLQIIALPADEGDDPAGRFALAGALVQEITDWPTQSGPQRTVKVHVTGAIAAAVARGETGVAFRLQIRPGLLRDDGQINNYLLAHDREGEMARPHLILTVPPTEFRGEVPNPGKP